MGWFACCCGAPPSDKPKRESRPRHRRHRHRAGSRVSRLSTVGRLPAASVTTSVDGDWHDARENFSICDPSSLSDPNDLASYSPTLSGPASPRAARGGGSSGHATPDGQRSPGEPSSSYSSGSSASDAGSSSDSGSGPGSPGGVGLGARLASCLTIMRHTPLTGEAHETPLGAGPRYGYGRMRAGASLPRRMPGESTSTCSWCWDIADAHGFKVRGADYMRTKQKTASAAALYHCVAADMFKTDAKAFHVAKQALLPPAPPPVLVPAVEGGAADVALPPLLIFNLQLPNYPASFFGSSDGPSESLVLYFALPNNFDVAAAKAENGAALGLLARFVSNGREADGTPTRERLKLIARVINPDEWLVKGPLTATEHKLLVNYNEKPVLTRPQHYFYTGPGYLEVDLDIHSYAFLARRALNSFHSRLKDVVWEVGLVVQGNSPEELPEQVLGCVRLYRTNFETMKSLSELQPQHTPSGRASRASDPGDPAGLTKSASGRRSQEAVRAVLVGEEAAEGRSRRGSPASATPSPEQLRGG